MIRLKNIIQQQNNFKFIIITHNKNEFETLRNILSELDFEHSIPICNLSDMMNDRVQDEPFGYECCWRISDYMGVCWDGNNNLNDSIKYWKEYEYDIYEIKDGNLCHL